MNMVNKCGFVAVAGMPNTGKSTLMNHFLHEKISIVTPKPQTTRTNVTCILTTDDYQIIFIDTPGILTPTYRMQEVMTSFISNAISESDVILMLIDASEFNGSFPQSLVHFAENADKNKIIVGLNKIDLIKKMKLLDIIGKTSELFPDAEIVPVSALDGDGTDELLSMILDELPEGPSLYPDDILSSEPERFFVAELIREAIFLTMEREIPYSSAVIIDKFDEKKSKVIIYASILVEKKSQKPIIIGKHGASIKKIGSMARFGIEEFLGKEVYLDLHVKVRTDWRKKDYHLREIGLIRR